MIARRQRSRGFTLMEVMISLAIVAGVTTVMLRAVSENMMVANRARALGVATDLARAKMYDIEEELLQEGFQDLDQSLDGEFDDEGWPDIKWEAEIVKVELPGLATAEAAAGADGIDGDGEDGAIGPSAGMGGLPGMAGGGMDPASMAGAGLIGSQFELLSGILETSIRKVTLKLTWMVGPDEVELIVEAYFTDPTGIARGMAGGGSGEGSGSGDDTSGDTPEKAPAGGPGGNPGGLR